MEEKKLNNCPFTVELVYGECQPIGVEENVEDDTIYLIRSLKRNLAQLDLTDKDKRIASRLLSMLLLILTNNLFKDDENLGIYFTPNIDVNKADDDER